MTALMRRRGYLLRLLLACALGAVIGQGLDDGTTWRLVVLGTLLLACYVLAWGVEDQS